MELLSKIKKSICLETCILQLFLLKIFEIRILPILGLSETKFLSSNLDV